MIPLATTTISVLRPDQDGTADTYDGVSYTTVLSGVRAVIGSPGGTETVAGGSSEVVGARLHCDPIDLRHTDRVVDDTTGETWQVEWTRRRIGFGLDHTIAGLNAVTDRVAV